MKIKPCPFCGGLPKLIKRTAWDTPTHIQCTVCGSHGPHCYVVNQEDTWKTLESSAISGWNTRDEAENKRLREACSVAIAWIANHPLGHMVMFQSVKAQLEQALTQPETEA